MADQADTPEQGFTAEDLRTAGVILGTRASASSWLGHEIRTAMETLFDQTLEQTGDPSVQAVWPPAALTASKIVASAALSTMLQIPRIIQKADARGEL